MFNNYTKQLMTAVYFFVVYRVHYQHGCYGKLVWRTLCLLTDQIQAVSHNALQMINVSDDLFSWRLW